MGKSSAFNIGLTSEVCFRGCLLSVIGLENRGFGIFQNLLYRQGIAACVAHLDLCSKSHKLENQLSVDNKSNLRFFKSICILVGAKNNYFGKYV